MIKIFSKKTARGLAKETSIAPAKLRRLITHHIEKRSFVIQTVDDYYTSENKQLFRKFLNPSTSEPITGHATLEATKLYSYRNSESNHPISNLIHRPGRKFQPELQWRRNPHQSVHWNLSSSPRRSLRPEDVQRYHRLSQVGDFQHDRHRASLEVSEVREGGWSRSEEAAA